MFTGIVQDLGKIIDKSVTRDGVQFVVQPQSKNFLKDVKEGDSISVNGACMTVQQEINANIFSFTTINESLKKTNMGLLKKNDFINLEKAMRLNSRLDGHILQGHVDITGIINKISIKKNSREYFIQFDSKFSDNIIYVGSIAINGVSLTIAEIVKETSKYVLIKVAIIPHTYEITNFKFLQEKDLVNIEFDVMGKYVKRLISKEIK